MCPLLLAAQPYLTEASGRVELPVRADQITVQLSVATESRSAADAADRNAARARAAMDAARRSAGSSGVRMVYYDLGPAGAVGSFTVTARFEATASDLAAATRLADAAREAGGARLISSEDSQRDTTAARQSAIRMAAQEARRNLDSLADAAGGRVERLASASVSVSPVFTIRTGDFSFIPGLTGEETAAGIRGLLVPQVALSAWSQVQLSANLAGGSSARPIVTVLGDASVPIEPDQAEVRLGLVHLGSSAQAAAADLTARSQAVQAALRRLVGPGGDVVASSTRLEFTPANPQRRTPEGFRATQEILVQSSDLANAARLIDTAISAGANSFNGLSLGLRDEGAVQRELERQAVRRAIADAAVAAGALNVRTGSVLAVRSAPGVLPAARVAPSISSGAELRRQASLLVDIELLQ